MEALVRLAVLSFFVSSGLAVDPLCLGVPNGEIYLVPYPGDCSRYYVCEYGYQTPESCPPGLWFNERLQSCDQPANSGCIAFACPPGVVDFFPYPFDCTKYVECYQGALNTYTCPVGLWFNPVQKRCVMPQESQCGDYGTTQQPTWPTPTADCYGVLPGRIVLRPYPNDCTLFIECYGSQETIRECPPYQYFDEARQMCDWPALSGCHDQNPPPPPPDNGDNDPRCADGNTNYWPDVECTKFVECYEGHGYRMDCPSGLYFDQYTKKCEDPSISSCGYVPPTVDPWSTTRGSGWTPDPFCPWPSYDRYLFPYPGDCTKFLVCYEGEKEVENCPPGLYFNPNLLVCDYPYHAGCYY